MNESSPHHDVAGYALGSLSDDQRSAFEAHLADCDSCRKELDDLVPVADLLASADPGPVEPPPPELAARTLLAVERAATPRAARRPSGRAFRPQRRWLSPALAALCLGAIASVALVVSDGDDHDPVEAVAELRRGSQNGTIALTKTGIGRVVRLRTDDLPILPKSEYYELWFVGPGDRPGNPNRISAGTFHPDANGRSTVTFAAAVDPRRYRRMAVTAEPGDGDPAPAGRDVLEGKIELR